MPSLLQTVLRGPSERARQGPAAWRREVWGRSRCGKSDRVVPQGARGIGPGASSLRVPCIFGWVDVCRSTDQARELCVYRHSAFRGDPVTAGISRIRGPVQGTGMRQGRARSAFLGSRPWWSSLRPRSAGSRVEPCGAVCCCHQRLCTGRWPWRLLSRVLTWPVRRDEVGVTKNLVGLGSLWVTCS